MRCLRVLWMSLMFVSLVSAVALAEKDNELDSVRHLIDTGQHDQAQQRLKAFMARHSDDVQARFLQGLILAHQGHIQQATAMFEALTREYPDLPEPYNNLAVLYAAQGRYEAARDTLLVAMNTHPSYARVHGNLGDVYAKMASIAYDRALELNRGQKAARLKLDLISGLSLVQNEAKDDTQNAISNHVHQPQVAVRQPEAAISRQSASLPVQSTTPEASGADERRIIEVVNAWAKAWSAKDIDAYLGFYAADFKPSRGLSRQAWQKQRRQRLRGPRYIEVQISDPEVMLLKNETVRVRFLQDYASNVFQGKSYKQLLLTKRDDQWRILEERVILE